MSKLYTFEVVPKYATRKLTDKVLFPDGYAYEKKMPKRQVIALYNTCNAVHVKHADKWYPVVPETIDAALAAIDANKAPAIADVPEAKRSIASYVTIPNPDDIVLTGKKASMFGDVRIENGLVIGELYMIKGLTEFNPADPSEQNGYYLPLGWTVNAKYTGPKMSVVNGKNTPVAMDPANLIFLGGPEVAFKKIIKVTATHDGKEVELAIHLNKVICVDNTVPGYSNLCETIPGKKQAPITDHSHAVKPPLKTPTITTPLWDEPHDGMKPRPIPPTPVVSSAPVTPTIPAEPVPTALEPAVENIPASSDPEPVG